MFQPCSSTATIDIVQPINEQSKQLDNPLLQPPPPPPPSHTLPPTSNRPKKKSSASEHGLRIRGVFHGNPQKNNDRKILAKNNTLYI